MSILYEFKVKGYKVYEPKADELADVCLDSMQTNFGSIAKLYELNVPKGHGVLGFAEFRQMMLKKFAGADESAFKAIGQMLDSRRMYFPERFKKLESSYNQKEVDELFYGIEVAGNNLFAELLPGKYMPAKVLEMEVEIVTTHPDAGFPGRRINASISRMDESNFLTRILGDITSDETYRKWENNPLPKWFIDHGGEWFGLRFKPMGNARGIIWGLKKLDEIIVKPSSAAFWKKHAQAWWATDGEKKELRFNYESNNQPWAVRTYKIYLHPNWFSKEILDKIIKADTRFDSTAHIS